ncbi:hypothetical protein [Laspinema palackyanum]
MSTPDWVATFAISSNAPISDRIPAIAYRFPATQMQPIMNKVKPK